MNAQKIRFLNAYSVKLLFHFFFKFGKKSHDSEFGIQRLAIVDLERVKGLKKNKMEVCRGVGTLQVYINAINFITNNSVSFSNQTDIFAPNRSRFIYFLRVIYFKEKTHIYTNNVEM